MFQILEMDIVQFVCYDGALVITFIEIMYNHLFLGNDITVPMLKGSFYSSNPTG